MAVFAFSDSVKCDACRNRLENSFRDINSLSGLTPISRGMSRIPDFMVRSTKSKTANSSIDVGLCVPTRFVYGSRELLAVAALMIEFTYSANSP